MPRTGAQGFPRHESARPPVGRLGLVLPTVPTQSMPAPPPGVVSPERLVTVGSGLMVDVENRATLADAIPTGVNLFLGAGFSVAAQAGSGALLPVGGTLASELRGEFNVDKGSVLPLPALYQLLASTSQEQVDAFLRARFTVGSFDQAYAALLDCEIDAIFTTNIDNLIHRIYENSKVAYLNDMDFEGPAVSGYRGIDLVMLHGSVLHDRRPLRFGPLDIASSFSSDPDRWRYLRHRLGKSPTIIWGYALQDAPTLEAIKHPTRSNETEGDKWIVLHPDHTDDTAIRYFRSLGFQIVVADTIDFLRFLAANAKKPAADAGNFTEKVARALIPQETVPLPDQVLNRPIADFFSGGSPTWSDVFSGVLTRTEYYNKVRDAILNPSIRLTVATGIPASGKTTLLMQLAAGVVIDCPKLILDGPTEDQANMVARLVGGAKVLIFVDNVANDARSIGALLKAPNARIVVAERDYNLKIVTHLLPTAQRCIVQITELSEIDVQRVRNSIPSTIRNSNLRHPKVEPGARPSIYEVVEANLKIPGLRQRYEKVIKDLRRSNSDVLEVLVIVCYTHSCRTSVSMDMAMAYFRNCSPNYLEIYGRLRDVGKLLCQEAGDGKADQDYFLTRSRLVADAVLAAASERELRSMLTIFHENISPSRIPRYHVFRVDAFSHKLFARAFTDWVDGSLFYDRLHSKKPSPYLLQQKALYLADKRKYSEAFNAIDLALSSVKGANFTIENTHARLLFRANIEKYDGSAAVIGLLDRSMEILRRCYGLDKRKAYHALTFGDHAKHYWDVQEGDKTHGYLNEAIAWLEEVQRTEPWERSVPGLLAGLRSRASRA